MKPSTAVKNRCAGSVLPTSIIFVAIMSTIGISAVQVTQTQVRLAHGEEVRAWVFQQASSAIQNTVGDKTTWPLAMQESNALCRTIPDSHHAETVNIHSGTRYEGSYAAAGYSISSNVPCCASHKFKVQGAAKRISSTAHVEQGMQVIGPKVTVQSAPSTISFTSLDLACADY